MGGRGEVRGGSGRGNTGWTGGEEGGGGEEGR